MSALLAMLFSFLCLLDKECSYGEHVWRMFLWTVGKVYSAIRDALQPYAGARG